MSVTKSLMMFSAIALLASPVAFAQEQADPGHPRVNEIDQRLENQEKRIQQGEASGKLTAAQGERLEKRDERVAKEEARDEAKHNGHLTKQEQRRMNKQLNHNSKKIHEEKHREEEHRQ